LPEIVEIVQNCKQFEILDLKPTRNESPDQWCNKTTKLQDQDHLFFQDQGKE